MNWLGLIRPLAKSEGFNVVQLVFMVIVGIFWAVGALLSKAQKEKARQKAEQLRREKIDQPDQGDDDAWQIIAPPTLRAAEDTSPTGAKPSITGMVKTRSQKTSRAKLAHLEQVHHLRHAKAKPLPVLHGEDSLPRHLREKQQTRLEPQAETGRVEKHSAILAGLENQTSAREAIIFHEIFSPPKALREEPSLWE
jgi:hypothetical protein